MATSAFTGLPVRLETKRDLEEIPENVKAELAIHPVKWIDEVLAIALEQPVEQWQVEK
jgi:ATP-dependent Lon protease